MHKIKQTAYYIILAISTVIMVACGSKKEQQIVIIPDIEKNHLQRNHIFGDVKEIRQIVYAYAPDDTLKKEGQLVSSSIQCYSADGYLKAVVTLGEDGDTISFKEIHYNKDAQEIEWIEYNAQKEIVASCQYEYDMNHFKIGERHFQKDSLTVHIQYKTDGMGNPIEITQNYSEYVLRNTVTYNKNGLVSRIDEFEPNGKPFKYITIEYDNYGDEVNRRVFKTGDKLVEYTYHEYDNEGRLLKKIYEDRLHDMQETYVYSKHDSHGNWLCEDIKKLGNIAFQRNREIIYY